MAKTKEKSPTIASVTIKYDLFDLPTAQHKAGLAGLVLQIQDMEDRAKKGSSIPSESIPCIDQLSATSATVTFTEVSMQGLLDDLYAAQVVETAVKSKWQGRAPKREEEFEETEENGKKKKTKRFIYEVIQPTSRIAARQDARAASPDADRLGNRRPVQSRPAGHA
jgi:CRISPR-associated protein Cmx8